MKKKSESIKCFEKYHKMAETHTGKKIVTVNTVHRSNQPKENIMALRTDNGGEYISNTFKTYLQQHGIQHQTTITYTPQENGAAERMNRTLIDLVRSMLYAQNMDKVFRPEEIQTAVYIRNRVISRSLPI